MADKVRPIRSAPSAETRRIEKRIHTQLELARQNTGLVDYVGDGTDAFEVTAYGWRTLPIIMALVCQYAKEDPTVDYAAFQEVLGWLQVMSQRIR